VGTATQTTAVMEITLPEMYQELPYDNEDYLQCPRCKHVDHKENWNTDGYYDIPDLIRHLHLLNPDAIRVGEETSTSGTLYRMLRLEVAEHSKFKCSECSRLWTEEQLNIVTKWDCSNCGETWDAAHDALTCCYGECHFDQCSHRDGIRVEADSGGAYHPLRGYRMGSSTFFKCFCRRDEEWCGNFVCVVCHNYVQTEAQVAAHRCEGLRSGTPVFSDGVYRGTAECFCEAGFCCELHQRHKRGHILCWK